VRSHLTLPASFRQSPKNLPERQLDFDCPTIYYIHIGYIQYGPREVKKAPEDGPDPGSLLPLTPAVFHILLALAGGGCHGYGIMQEVDRLTKGQLRLGPGTLYRSIQRMLVDGLIEETTEGPESGSDDERRRNYRLTDLGRAVARAEAVRLEILVETARERNLLKEN
jgi:DNA-binding PadR family transcriptional regulator